MPEVLAQGESSSQRKRFVVPEGAVTLGRRAGDSEWVIDWDPHIHGAHVSLRWQDNALHVAKLPNKPNPMFFHGKESESAVVKVGDCFILGSTTFRVLAGPEATPSAHELPADEMTCRFEELEDVAFTDPDIRLDLLAKLPELIRRSASEEELEARVVDALLRGIPGANSAALVQLDPRSTEAQPVVVVKTAAGEPAPQVSRQLVYKAAKKVRQGFVHDWSDKTQTATVKAGLDWALCTPLLDEHVAGYALYATGKNPIEVGSSHRDRARKSDLKFAGLLANIFVSLRRVLYLQARESLLRTFLSPTVVSALGQNEKEAQKTLKRRETLVTVLFCDLRGFSSKVEKSAGDLAAICDRASEALTVMTRNILDKDGVISDFQGDAAMGFWGWPIDDGEQVQKTARAALAIRKEFDNARRQPDHRLTDFACGIGIAHGPAIAGMLGTIDQFKVGVFGPVVNLASRLEGLTKKLRAAVLLDDAAAKALSCVGRFAVRSLFKVRPAGMSATVPLHELASSDHALSVNEAEDFGLAISHFESGNWGDALELLGRLPNDGPSIYLREFIAENDGVPPPDWDGVIVMKAK